MRSTHDDAQVSLPYQVKSLLSVFSITISFGLDGLGTPLECMHLRGYCYKLLMFMITPLSLALVLGTIAVVGTRRAAARRLSCREVLEAALPSFLRIMFLACALRSVDRHMHSAGVRACVQHPNCSQFDRSNGHQRSLRRIPMLCVRRLNP